MGDCGTGKSTIYEKLVMEESGHSSAAATSQTTVCLATQAPDGKVMVIDTPGQDVLTDQFENNAEIAVAFQYPLSLILVTAKAEKRLESIKSQIEDYIYQLCDSDCSQILCVAITHMDTEGIKWSRDDVRHMLRRQFGLSSVVFSGSDIDREDLLQQVLSCASPEPLDLSAATEGFQEMFTISDDKMRALKSINDLVVLFTSRCDRFLAMVKANSDALGLDGVAELIFEFKKTVDLEIERAQESLQQVNGWRLDGEARERYEQSGYLAYFKQAIQQKLEKAVATIEGLITAQPHLVRACPHCGCPQLASTAFSGSYGWSYSSNFSGLTCGGSSTAYENKRHEAARCRFQLPFKMFDAASADMNFIPPERPELSRGCGQYVKWSDMKHVQLPQGRAEELQKEAIHLLEEQAKKQARYLWSWQGSGQRRNKKHRNRRSSREPEEDSWLSWSWFYGDDDGDSGDDDGNVYRQAEYRQAGSYAESNAGCKPRSVQDEAMCGAGQSVGRDRPAASYTGCKSPAVEDSATCGARQSNGRARPEEESNAGCKSRADQDDPMCGARQSDGSDQHAAATDTAFGTTPAATVPAATVPSTLPACLPNYKCMPSTQQLLGRSASLRQAAQNCLSVKKSVRRPTE